jgi:ribosome biogenesis GTPase A
MDRTMLILEIFKTRAKTKEAMLQVEIANLNYMLPRLVGARKNLSRIGGGGGGGAGARRGAGETKLELDRRYIENRIYKLITELDDVVLSRKTSRKSRAKNEVKTVAFVGYTNAGKSTLINVLTNATTENKITTSSIPNTTIDFIKIKLENITIIDSPGFTNQNTLYNPEEFDLIKRIMPRTFLKPSTYQVKPISSILIEDKIRLQSSINNSLTFYISNTINVERVFDNNTSLVDKPIITLDIPDNSDLVIKSLGFINIKKSCKLTIHTDNKDLFEIRKSMF